MPIQSESAVRAAQLVDDFESDVVVSHTFVPSEHRNRLFWNPIEDRITSEQEAGWLQWLSNKAKEGEVCAPKSKATWWIVSYGNETIGVQKSNRGVSYHWFSPNEKGSRYGLPVLLAHDPEIAHFCADFCKAIKEIAAAQQPNKPKLKR